MKNLKALLLQTSQTPIFLLKGIVDLKRYASLDLSTENKELSHINISDPQKCQSYIEKVLSRNNSKIAYGGYLEKRNLYKMHSAFNTSAKDERNIHLGIDLWAKAGTEVLSPMDGKIHSFKNNSVKGDYGPTIILEHKKKDIVFYSLYGHLSIDSLDDLYVGKEFKKGSVVGRLGDTAINVNYAPHLHFQLIHNIGQKKGDYPGVCSSAEVAFYSKNCPNPNLLLKIDTVKID